MKIRRHILSLLLACVLVATPLAGCKNRKQAVDPGASKPGESTSQGTKPAEEADKTVGSVTPDHTESVKEKQEQNTDTIGWLQVRPTSIDDVVVQKKDDTFNQYYMRRNFNKESSFNGIFYADSRASIGDGTREQFSTNICIYGHALTDDPKAEKYGILFSELHDLRDPELAKDMPYIYFSTDKENVAYEIFAVMIVNTDDPTIPYNGSNETPGEYYKMVKEKVLPRSIYNYDVELKEDDKFISLSTCLYKMWDESPLPYPSYLRYVVMGRMVDADTPLKEEAVFTLNKDVVLDKNEPIVTIPKSK